MNFSYEELFYMYGQYDSHVMLEFHVDSEAYRTFMPTLMGTFKYTLDERRKIQSILSADNIPRTNQYTKFIPSTLEKLSFEQKEILDKKGIQNSDIAVVSSVNLPKYNRFAITGQKDILNVMKIPVDSSGIDVNKMKFGFFNSRLNNGDALIPEEEYEYLGIKLFLFSDQIDEELKLKVTDEKTGQVKESIRFYQLKAKFYNNSLSNEEDVEFGELFKRRCEIRDKIIDRELTRSSEKLKDIATKYDDTLLGLKYISFHFEEELLLPYKLPIWWDFEHFLHVYIRHVKETKIGERFDAKTIFQYKFKDVQKIVVAVLDSVYGEIKQHFIEHPKKNFRRMGSRSVYYDGVYYRVEIEPTGRLIAFHPYNDGETNEGSP